jgi:hypothetical protein
MRFDCVFPATSNVNTGSTFARTTRTKPALAKAHADCSARAPRRFLTVTPQRRQRSSVFGDSSRSRQAASQLGHESQIPGFLFAFDFSKGPNTDQVEPSFSMNFYSINLVWP